MGASPSHPTEDSVLPPVHAFHVLRVTPGSPASQTDIEPFFDFVVSVEQGLLRDGSKGIDVHHLERIVEHHESKPLHLIVWSSKSETYRQVVIVPSRLWSIPTPYSPQVSHSRLPSASPSTRSHSTSFDKGSRKPSLLGLSMRVCEPAIALDNVWHILDVLEGSPAESAGLVPFGDWVIGWSGGVLREENDFLDVVEAHVDKPLRVYIYSYDFDTLREVVLVPNRMWGGEGLLGCGVGFGLLHRIPKVRQVVLAPEEDVVVQSNHLELERDGHGQLISDDMQEHELFVPADDIVYDDEEAQNSDRGPHPNVHPSGGSLASTHRIVTNPFLPDDDSEALPRVPNAVVPPADGAANGRARSRSPSPASTTTPTSPSFHGSELMSEPPLTPMNPPLQPRPSDSTIPFNSFRQLSGGATWGGAASRFSAAPARRATPTQFNPNERNRPAEDGSSSDDEKNGFRGFRRSPSGSMTSVDD